MSKCKFITSNIRKNNDVCKPRNPRPATPAKGEALIAGIAAESLRLIALWRAEHGL